MKPLFSLLLLAVTCASANAQNDIKVLLVKGKVEKWSGKAKPTLLANSGTAIGTNDTIKLYADAELMLTANSKALSVKTAGKYSTAKLNQLFEKEPTSEKAAKFLNFLSKELKPEKENYQDYASSHMKEKGSVKRGPHCSVPLMLMPINGTITVEDSLPFRWKRNGAKSFVFSIYSLPEDGPAVFTTQTNDTSIVVMAQSAKLQYGKNYFWQVANVDTPACDRTLFSRISVEAIGELESQYKEMKDVFSMSLDVSLLVAASKSEQDKLYLSADHAYRILLQVYPEREDIRQIYASFLARVGLADEAQQVLIKPKKK